MKDKEFVAVDKIVIRLGDVAVDLSIEQIRELQRALDDIFPRASVAPIVIRDPYPVYPYPWVRPRYERPYITWSTGGLDNNTRTGTLSIQATHTA